MTDQQFNQFASLLENGFCALNGMLAGIEAQLQQLAIAANPAPNYQKPLADYWRFDWSIIGAIPRGHDDEGVTSVEWNGRLFTRRSPQNKFQEAVWFSRATGKDELGNNKYEKLITFKDAAAAEELGSKVKKAAASTASTASISTHTSTAPQQQAQEYVRLNQIKVFGEGASRTWRVGDPGTDSEVWRDEAGIRQCNCQELARLRRRNAKAECPHIQAVALSLAGKASAVNGQVVAQTGE